MGVTGLWRLIEPAGKPVPVETLENKVLAVDISIWLHQMVKGYQDAKGAPLPNAHLMGLFQRLCKLLYFRIKPVFVFDGGFPDLKRETIAKRQDNKAKYNSESERIRRELALLLSKKSVLGNLLGKEIISPSKTAKPNTAINDDLFKLPALPENKEESESESEDESSSSSTVDLHSVDIESNSFKSLPVKEKYDLLIELKETRKMNSWGRLNELPKKSDNFSDFQMQRLLKRRKVQECLEETEKEMGDGGMSLNDLESLLNEEGIDTKIDMIPTRRIASNDNTRFLLINNVKQALEAKKKMAQNSNPGTSKEDEVDVKMEQPKVKDESEEDLEKAIKMSLGEPDSNEGKEKGELEEDLEKAIKMSLECVGSHDTSNYTSKTDDSWTSALTDNDYSDHTDSEEGDGCDQPDMSSAKAYIMQYSDLTNRAINQIITSKHPAPKKNVQNIEKILDEINKEKSIILDKVDLSSDEDCSEQYEQISNEDSSKLNDKKESFDNDIDLTQASVLYVENTPLDTITLDSSGEENSYPVKQNINDHDGVKSDITITNAPCIELVKVEIDSDTEGLENISEIEKQTQSESNSSDDEFEDVPEIGNQAAKPILQLTLEMGQTCDNDDIFADVFTSKETNDIKTESPPENDVCVDKPIDNTKLVNLKDLKTYEVTNIDKEIHNPVNQNTIQSNPVEVGTINIHGKLTEKSNESHNILESKSTPEDETNKVVSQPKLAEKSSVVQNKLANNDTSKEKDLQQRNTRKNDTLPKEIISAEKLNEMAEAVANEEQNLVQEKSRLDRIGRNITEQMTKEAQELLQLFGIPYIIAPMEAEAQCAFLESVKLTDGTITDDSDIWLFGGKTVYKNFFNQKKHVLQFLSERIERSYNLTREQLILLALLVGSDYTTGINGIGPVTALEILASFPFNKKQLLKESSKQDQYHQIITGMQEFKNWVGAGKRTDNTSLKKKLKNVKLNDDFPSVRVVQAYLEPNVEKSKDNFTWGEIDITILREYTKKKFGWSQNKLDEIIKPVLKRLQDRKNQKTVDDYFKRKVEFQSLELQMSKRVHAAVQQMAPEPKEKSDANDDDEPDSAKLGKPSRKRKLNKDNVPKTRVKPVSAGASKKIKITANSEMDNLNVRSVVHVEETASGIEIVIPKTDRCQEIIPQREKEKQSLLQNKMKAIEIFRKTKIDKKKKVTKRKVILPKEKADLSESSDEN